MKLYTVQNSGFQLFRCLGTSGTLVILLRYLNVQISTIRSTSSEQLIIGGTSGFHGTGVEKHCNKIRKSVVGDNKTYLEQEVICRA